MKKILITTLVLLSFGITKAQIIKAELTATGLTCSMCSKATYNQLISIPEVQKVETDLNKTAFILHFKSGTAVSPGELKQKVEDAGFSVGELIVTFKFDNQKAENNNSFTQNNITYTFMNIQPGVLSGEVRVQVLNKGFVVEKEYKKLSKLSKLYPTYATADNKSYHIKTL